MSAANYVEDRTGAWFATWGGGLVRLRPTALRTHRPPDGEADNVPRLWWEAETRTLWAHGARTGWWPVGGEAGGAPLEPPTEGCPAWNQRWFRGPDGERWIACPFRVFRPGPAGWIEDSPPESGDAGPVWGTARGLVLGGERGQVSLRTAAGWETLDGPDGPVGGVLSLVERGDGSLVLGGTSGLAVAPAGGGPVAVRWEAEVRHLRLDGPRLWVSTVEHGLCLLSADSVDAAAGRCLGSGSSVDRATVHASVSDGRGRVWISTNQGIGVLDAALLTDWVAGGAEPPVLWLDRADGMRSPEGNGYAGDAVVQTPDGHLWFATQDGVVEADPAAFSLPEPPRVVVRPVQVGEDVVTGTVRLPVEHAPLAVRWSTGAGTWAEQAEFRHRIGTDGVWSAPSRGRGVTLPSLPPRASELQVQARIGGAWGPVATLAVERAPALHERGFFPLLVGLVGIAALAAVAVGRGAVLARNNRRLQEQVDAQTQRLAAQNADLVQRADELAERNARIAAQARQLAELDELKRQLIDNVSHELRTPLSLVLAPIGTLLAETEPGSRAARHLQLAADSARRLDQLIGQLFDLSRAQAGGLRLRVRRVELGAVLADLQQRFEALADGAGVRIERSDAVGPVQVWVEHDLLDKVLTNLVSNALRYAPPGTAVRLGLIATEDQAEITVEDAGPGVPEALRERIFERFFQVRDASAGPAGGTGLGLSLARELVELHGGGIGVEDAGPGARFRVTLPLGVAHVSPDEIEPDEAAPVPPVPMAAGERTGARVLLVEDHPQLRAYLAEVLGERFDVTTAANGAIALQLAREERFDLVISDIMMPVMDGPTLVAALRALPGGDTLPVLFASARGELQDRVDGLGQADDYLPKPFQAPELVARAVALLRRSRLPSREGAPADREQAALLDKLAATADPRLGEPDFSVGALAKAMAMSPRTLQLRMAAVDLPPPRDWLRVRRLERARALIRSGEVGAVAEAADAVGLSRSYFTRAYAAHFGQSPGEALRAG